MAFSTVNYPGNGAQVNFSVTFPYLLKPHVKVTVDGVLKTDGVHYSWLNSTTIAMVTPPATGSVLLLSRDSSRAAALVDFVDASSLTEEQLDRAVLQALYIAQEAFDNSGTAAADAAAASAASAASSASAAATSATTAGTNATVAQDWAIKTSGPVSGAEYSAKYHAQSIAAQAVNLKNLVINGDHQVDQRNLGASVAIAAGADSFVTDRWRVYNVTDGALAVQQNTSEAASAAGAETCLKITVTTADASIGSSQYVVAQHKIEGFWARKLRFGTSDAKALTLSLQVRSSVTGTFSGVVRNGAANRSYPFTYTISAANTLEYKTVTVPGDVTGTWAKDHTTGIDLLLCLCAGSTFTGPAGGWTTSTVLGATGQVNFMATNGSTFSFGDVQVEPGSTATPFERLPYQVVESLAFRYYEKTVGNVVLRAPAAVAIYGWFSFKARKRNTPTMTLVSPTYSSGNTGSIVNPMVDGCEATFTATAVGGFMSFSYTADAEI